MTYKPLNKEEAVNLTKLRESDFSGFIAYLEAITAPAHDASEHAFNDPKGRGICETCGWVHPEVPAACCGEPMRDHVLQFLQLAKDIRDGVRSQIINIEVTIIEIDTRPRRRGPFG